MSALRESTRDKRKKQILLNFCHMAERLVESKLISREAYTSFTVLNLFTHGRGFLNDFLIYASEGLVKWAGICETNLFLFI